MLNFILFSNSFKLSLPLISRQYTPFLSQLICISFLSKSTKTFAIRDPKTRVISASAFWDRIIHHAVCNIIEPVFEKLFIYDSYANRKGKGTHAALKRFDEFKRKVSGNGKLLLNSIDNNMVYGYVLKADIKHYFDSVDHEIMMKIISRKTKDENILWLIRKILDNHPSENGMPIGNLTSQFFANVYLNELDYFVKHKLRTKYYIRYVDDFVILDVSKERLEFYRSKINKFLKTIKLELHTEKSKVIPFNKGIKLLGFRVFYKYKLPYKRNVRGFENRFEMLLEDYKNNKLSSDQLRDKINGWLAYAECANTHKLRNCIKERLNKELG